jgi:SNF2 family DNA or RNA helicase
MGTGKSATVVNILRNKYNKNKKILRTLIVCPKAVVLNWEREILKFSKIPLTKILILTGPVSKRVEYLENFDKDAIYITNFEAMTNDKFVASLLANPPNCMVIDESHRTKNPAAKRSKMLIKLSEQMEKLSVHHRYILTGTPVLQNTMDLFSQFLILNQGKTFGKNFFAFRANYFRDKNAYMPKQKHFPAWVPTAGSEDKLKALMEPHVVTAKKEDCLDLPPLLKTTVPVELSAEQKKAYDAMKKDFIAFIDEKGPAVATLALTKALRMQQIISGHLTLEDGAIHSFMDNPRLDALEELLEDITPSEKVIVWATW